MSDVQHARGLRAAMAGFRSVCGGAKRRLPWRLLGVGAATAVVLAVWLTGPRPWQHRPLTFAMTEGEVQAGGYFRAASESQPRLQFSDGTRIDLRAGARGRIAAVDESGAHVMIDEGETRVRVVPRAGARWQFDAGPFVVRVQGTEFALAWRGDEGRLDVRLHEGALSVNGPLSDQAIVLHPGQWLTVRLAAREVFVRDFDRSAPLTWSGGDTDPAAPAAAGPVAALPEPGLAPVPAPAKERPRPAARVATALPEKPEANWARARSEGDWERILDLATRPGLERTLAERGSEDLALLADAAHYRHRDDIAEQALLAQRRRFPGTTRAKDAAFLLGRIVEAKPGGAGEALAWYDRHLAEAPDGAYTSEALGRKLTVLARLRGHEAARPIAQEYLERYPGGSYARAARVFAGKP
jgi:TolA-binding protein